MLHWIKIEDNIVTIIVLVVWIIIILDSFMSLGLQHFCTQAIIKKYSPMFI